MKKIGILILILMLALGLFACGDSGDKGGDPDISIDIAALGADILAAVTFEDEIVLIDEDMIDFYYEIPEGGKGVFYYGSGATAEEIAVFEVAEYADLEAMKTAAQTHIQDQIDSYADYIPEEVTRLENALIDVHGRYVIVCVAADTAPAQEVINGYFYK